ncbi:FAD-binding-3 domain-containing protein [Mycena indigotica]|uniref:FAD-binding-3 domain-containing protein n=1 Tax=Mycena indigotica TaxID=2126181 RepID=A0A8H6S2F8_9AGAR|nr:FAD-binding-3 domain-containing protein [Mycena indigotica]KAF7290816.1 FAD-binding-3 domain-containing protein [Mycena indigotica]
MPHHDGQLVQSKEHLEALIKSDFAFDGTFAFSIKYPLGDAPNPYLTVDDVGSVGIPLGERDAHAFSFSDKNLCEVAPDKISFGSPQWDAWVQGTIARLVTENFALSGSCSLSFQKLVVSKRGCEAPIASKEFSAVGYVIFFLPSNFEGSQLAVQSNVDVDGFQKNFDVATDSSKSTTIVAWYAGCQLDSGSVRDGHRVALVYNIVPTIDSPSFGLPDMSEPVKKLHHVLQTWKESTLSLKQADSMVTPPPPTHLACVLRRTYQHGPAFSSMSLKGADKLLSRELSSVARQLGFRLYMAHVEGKVHLSCHIRGYDPYDDDYEEEFDESEFDQEGSDDDGENLLVIKQVVDMGGMPVDVDELTMKEYNEQDYICGPVIDFTRTPDNIEFERDERSSAHRIKTWKRTVILILLDDSELGRSVVPGDMYDYAAHFFNTLTTTSPTPREKIVAEALISRISAFKHPVEKKHAEDNIWFYATQEQRTKAKKKEASRIPVAVTLLCQCAERWKDLELFFRVLAVSEAEQNISIVGIDGMASACGTFGWDVLKDFCSKAIQTDPSLRRKHALVDRLTVFALEHDILDLAQWCAEQKALLPAVAEVTGKKRPSTEHKTIPAKKRKA